MDDIKRLLSLNFSMKEKTRKELGTHLLFFSHLSFRVYIYLQVIDTNTKRLRYVVDANRTWVRASENVCVQVFLSVHEQLRKEIDYMYLCINIFNIPRCLLTLYILPF